MIAPVDGQWHAVLMDEDSFDPFKENVKQIVDLTDELATAPEWQRDQDWVIDRVMALKEHNKELLRLWPIKPGCGDGRERGDDQTRFVDTE